MGFGDGSSVPLSFDYLQTPPTTLLDGAEEVVERVQPTADHPKEIRSNSSITPVIALSGA